MVQKDIQLEVWTDNTQQLPHVLVKQGEVQSRLLRFKILASSEPVDLTGAMVTFYFTKPDGRSEYLPAMLLDQDREPGGVSVLLTSQSCAAAGRVTDAEIRLRKVPSQSVKGQPKRLAFRLFPMDNGLILVFDKTVKTVLYEFLIKRLKAFY